MKCKVSYMQQWTMLCNDEIFFFTCKFKLTDTFPISKQMKLFLSVCSSMAIHNNQNDKMILKMYFITSITENVDTTAAYIPL